ncbi:MAG: RNA methyltransferase [Deinococcus sp.]|nr:RNA methyltransferase [Deinococcus sp.]
MAEPSAASPAALEHVVVVLVHPQEANNIGATARAMRNCGLTRLRLVAPEEPLYPDAYRLAAGAHAVLDQARLFPALDDALADCALVIGTTARRRKSRLEPLTPREAAPLVLACSGLAALVFGPERTGLTNQELDRCTYLVTIPTDPTFPSLNLAQAVLLVGYELFLAATTPPPREHPTATARELENFYAHLQRVLTIAGSLGHGADEHMMRTMRELISRARPTPREVVILRGVLSELERTMGARGTTLPHSQ